MLFGSRSDEISRLRFRVGGVLVIRECLRLFFAWIMIWAAAVVALRAIFLVDRFVLLWGCLGLPVVAAVGIFLAIRKLPSSTAIRATLDRHGCLGGLLMAAGDTDIGPWSERVPNVGIPAIRWQSGRQWLYLLSSIAFLIAAMLAPDRFIPTGNETALEIGGEMQKLADKIQVLKQEKVLPPEKAKVLEKDLNRIRQEALGHDPAKTMETLDHLEQSLSKAASEAAESAIKQTETASRLQELATALNMSEDRMDSKQLNDAMKELAQIAQEAAAENEQLAEALSKELQEALRQGNLTEAQLQQLREAMKDCKACQRAKLMKLVDAKLIEGDELRICDKAGECDEATLAAILSECKDGKELAAAIAGGLPGRGGVSRGRADAAMTWQKEVQKKNAAFKEKVLPPAAVASFKKSRWVGLSAGDPTAKKQSGGSTGGALESAQAGGGESHSQIILPEHEKTVERYFNREKK